MSIPILHCGWHERVTTNKSDKGHDAEQHRFSFFVTLNQDNMLLKKLSG